MEHILCAALRNILRPLVRILLRNGISYGTFAEHAKQVFVDVAFEDGALPNRKPTASRVSTLTGLTRKEVARLRDLNLFDDQETSRKYNRAVRVIGGWLNDPRFCDAAGQARPLPVSDGADSFAELVRLYSGDIPTQAMLEVLQAAGSIVKNEQDGLVYLVRPAYLPASDPADKINILGTDVGELITTIDHNLTAEAGELRFQRKVSNSNVDPAAVANFKQLAGKKAQKLLVDLDNWLYQHEAPTGTATDRSPRYVSVGIYFYENDAPEESE